MAILKQGRIYASPTKNNNRRILISVGFQFIKTVLTSSALIIILQFFNLLLFPFFNLYPNTTKRQNPQLVLIL